MRDAEADRGKLESRILDAEARYRSLFQTTGQGVIYQNRDGVIIDANPAAERILGLTLDQLQGRTSMDPRWRAVREDGSDFPGEEHPVVIALRTGKAVRGVVMGVHHPGDDAIHWVEVEGVPCFPSEGSVPSHAYALFTDITEKRRAQEALRSSERRFRSIVEQGWDMIVLADAAGRFLYASPSVPRILGWTVLEYATYIGERRGPRSASPELQKAWAELLHEPGGRRRFESRVQHRDGHWLWLENVLVNLLDDPDVRAMVGTARDITAHKEAELGLAEANAVLHQRVAEATEELMIKNEDLAAAARAKDEFFANMSHELRTPLNGVLGLTEALQEQIYGPLTDRQRDALKRIEQSGKHLLSLLSDILDLARIEAGKATLEIRMLPLGEVVRSSLVMVEGMARSRRIAVSVQVADGFASIPADERKLKQILVNLLGNAVKFSPDGGEVGLEVALVPAEGVARFTVWDHGTGIDPAVLPRLFRPFEQADGSLTRRYTGSGLGLAMVRRLAELHGGSVEVETEPGKGSRFTVRLPLHRRLDPTPPNGLPRALVVEGSAPAAKSPALVVGTARPQQRGRVLLAEDDEVNITAVVDYVRSRGYEVFVARDGAEAIDLAREIQPDAVLMDIQMPHLDGLQAIRTLRDDPALREMPIIALTALAMAGDRERCLAAGADDYLPKPVSLRRLATLLEELLGRATPG